VTAHEQALPVVRSRYFRNYLPREVYGLLNPADMYFSRHNPFPGDGKSVPGTTVITITGFGKSVKF